MTIYKYEKKKKNVQAIPRPQRTQDEAQEKKGKGNTQSWRRRDEPESARRAAERNTTLAITFFLRETEETTVKRNDGGGFDGPLSN